MATLGGGMAFEPGIVVRVSDPPQTLPAQQVRLSSPVKPNVKTGEEVVAGQTLARPDDPAQAGLAAPLAGTVGQIMRRSAGEGAPSWHELTIWPKHHHSDTVLKIDPPREAEAEPWLHRLASFGPWGQPALGPDLLAQVQHGREHGTDAVICVGLDAFPPYPVRSSLLESFPDEAAAGTRLIADWLKAERAEILVRRDLGELRRLRRSCRRSKLTCRTTDNVYPDADPTLVVYARGKRGRRMLPHGSDPATRGVVLVSPWNAIRLGRWLANEAIDLARPYFVGWARPRTPMRAQWAFPGQPLAQLAEALGGTAEDLTDRAVIGHPMTGRPITAPNDNHGRPLAPVTPEDEHLIALLTVPAPREPDPCISCGWCAEVCPTRLQPIRLAELAQHHPAHRRLADRLNWCIDCGLCSHVCPSQIPLAQTCAPHANNKGTTTSRHE